MNNIAEVYMWGTRIGSLQIRDNLPFAEFEYDKEFIENARGTDIQLSPLQMPLSDRVYSFPDLAESFHGVPGMIADSLPDKFGNAVINQWLASQGKTEADFNVIDRLCYTGSRGMGALEYRPAISDTATVAEKVNVNEMVKFASDVLNKRKLVDIDMKSVTYSQLLKLGTSAGGARAKAVIAWNEKTNEVKSGQINPEKGFDYWLMKFDGVSKNGDHNLEDEPEYTLIEYAYYLMAVKAGIQMNECRIFKEGDHNHFMTKRFDRVDGKKIHMQTLAAIAHIDYNTPRICSYELASTYMHQMGLGHGQIEQFFRRMVFNVIAVNRDDHVKNVSFLMDRNGIWSLSPAYDITFSYNPTNKWLQKHQMMINDKSESIMLDDLIQAGIKMGISKVKAKSIIDEVKMAVGQWPEIAESLGIRLQTVEMISNMMDTLVKL
jgi:serine/threonine-protein kinase HipA